MGRPKKPFPPQPAESNGKMRVWWNGRWHHLGLVADEPAWKAEYARLVQRWSVDPTADARRPDDYLVATLFRDYLASDACPPGEARARVGRVMSRLLAVHLETAVEEFDAPALAAFQAAMCRERDDEGRPKYAVTYVREAVMWVRKVWRWGVATKRVRVERYQELLTVDGPKAGRKPGQARPPRRVQAARPADVEAALPFLRPPTRAMVELRLLAGFWPSELFRLTPAQVHRAGVVDVPEVGEVDLDVLGVRAYLPVDADGQPLHKSDRHGRPRWVLLGGRAQAVLAPFLGREPHAPCFSPRDAVADLNREKRAGRKSKVQPSQRDRRRAGAKARGEAYTGRTYRQAVHRACAKAGVPAWNPYALRHRHAVDVDAALGLDHAQAALGHSSPQTTRRYSKQSFTRAAEVAKKLG